MEQVLFVVGDNTNNGGNQVVAGGRKYGNCFSRCEKNKETPAV